MQIFRPHALMLQTSAVPEMASMGLPPSEVPGNSPTEVPGDAPAEAPAVTPEAPPVTPPEAEPSAPAEFPQDQPQPEFRAAGRSAAPRSVGIAAAAAVVCPPFRQLPEYAAP